MKDIRPAIRALLLANPAVNTAVGGTRIYPVTLPQGVVLDSVVQNLVTESSDYNMLGPSGLGQARVQLDCWSLTTDGSVRLGGLVHDVLSGFKGTIPFGSNSPPDTLFVCGVFKDNGHDDYDSVAKLYSRRRDFVFYYSEFDVDASTTLTLDDGAPLILSDGSPLTL